MAVAVYAQAIFTLDVDRALWVGGLGIFDTHICITANLSDRALVVVTVAGEVTTAVLAGLAPTASDLVRTINHGGATGRWLGLGLALPTWDTNIAGTPLVIRLALGDTLAAVRAVLVVETLIVIATARHC